MRHAPWSQMLTDDAVHCALDLFSLALFFWAHLFASYLAHAGVGVAGAADYNKTGRYIINYSQMNTECNCQNITFAESYDLIHWTNGK